MRSVLRVLFFLSIFLFISCQSEDISTEVENEVEIQEAPVINNEAGNTSEQSSEQSNNDSLEEFEEYFEAQMGASEMKVSNPDAMYVELWYNPVSGVTALFLGAYTEDPYQEFMFNVCFYEGVGTHNTGAGNGNEYCYYFNSTGVWYSDGDMEKIGIVNITKVTGDFIEGDFDIYGFNEDNPDLSMDMIGKFGLYVEEN